jgi:uncharacterized protein YegP (UPF0339 family)
MARFELFEGRAGDYRWRFRANNGEIVAQSEGYTTKAAALNGVNVLRREAATAAIEDLTKARAY